ncbi:MAG: 4-(cytidine 5'-diphospho)-2-C-methyl-D-erythritol kinase [Cellvibrionales bacterium TMED148]|nr:4-(cytidine 5'-diphospho)-2-C-methyl-D-erythritol kinase [Porticoccaceae bacterium]MAJ87952.1 4-(cytidine 5'-diphospho)-2-C-methyl-D-erythritol kinase [Porticoccaceae bacterium]RPG88226.1 MAG: 4-(cytidine 5'-diphospho)-2-C-methyl-D-erythritol kinase [Cellvibrionales bacterium TMED148]RPG89389.1 MAG: 4-(cytidine 5'-diphospho)-2-C-methyl-D-erythritol kinase [Cellvibrionales bacterium TMED148]
MKSLTKTITVFAPGKLNLFLNILGKRHDGYHNIQTLFQLLDIGDEISFEVIKKNEIVLSHDLVGVRSEDNLIVKSAELLQKAANIKNGCHINLKKLLPIGAGLGGGSSDAATTLLTLNVLWDCNLNTDNLAILGGSLGADIPVFIYGQSALGEGIGNRLMQFNIPKRWYLIVTPPVTISTAQIFSHPQLTRNSPPIKMCALAKDQSFSQNPLKNDCQALVEEMFVEVEEVVRWAKGHGDPLLTGSGSSVFCSFQDRRQAEEILEKVPSKWSAFVAEGINKSPVHDQLGKLSIGA